MSHVMPEEHEALLKTAMKLPEEKNLPDKVVEKYWEVSRTCRRLGQNVSMEMLAVVCLLSGRPSPSDPVTILNSNPNRGDIVLARHRGEWEFGTFLEHKGHSNKILVELSDGLTEPREFKITDVRLPTREEAELVGA